MKLNWINPLLVILLSFIGFNGFAQEDEIPEDKKEKIQQLKIAYFSTELDLTTDEAEKFWPVYNEMEEKLKQERKTQKTAVKELEAGIDSLSDDAIRKKTNIIFDSEIRLAQIRKEYNTKIAEVIGYKKAAKLLSLEKQFRHELLKKLNEKQKPGGPQGKPGPRGPKGPPGGPRMPEE